MPTPCKRQRIESFYARCDEYRVALQSGNSRAIVMTSIRVHAAKGTVPRRLASLPGKIYRETRRNVSLVNP